jgi:hypothetical protein
LQEFHRRSDEKKKKKKSWGEGGSCKKLLILIIIIIFQLGLQANKAIFLKLNQKLALSCSRLISAVPFTVTKDSLALGDSSKLADWQISSGGNEESMES